MGAAAGDEEQGEVHLATHRAGASEGSNEQAFRSFLREEQKRRSTIPDVSRLSAR